MKILQINSVGQTDSTGRTCKEFADYINKLSPHSCYTAFANGNFDEYSFRISNKIEMKTHAVMSRLTGKQAHYSKLGTYFLIKFIKKIKPSIIILRNLHSNYINFPMLMSYLSYANIPVIFVLHDCWFFTGKCCHYTLDRCLKWQTGCKNCPRLHKDNISWIIDATSSLWKEKKEIYENLENFAVVGVSNWISREAEKSILSHANIIKTIYNWIDLSLFHPLKECEYNNILKIDNVFCILGVASIWDNSKGFHLFIELANMLPSDVKIILIGKIPSYNNLPFNIISVGKTESVEELVKYYNVADVLINLSIEETFGKVSAEALACGTPIICFNSTANPELCGDGCGYVCEKENLDEVLSCIYKIKNKGKNTYSKKCISFAKKKFDKEKNIEKWIKLMNDLIISSNRR